jgi:hypothetical protein
VRPDEQHQDCDRDAKADEAGLVKGIDSTHVLPERLFDGRVQSRGDCKRRSAGGQRDVRPDGSALFFK